MGKTITMLMLMMIFYTVKKLGDIVSLANAYYQLSEVKKKVGVSSFSNIISFKSPRSPHIITRYSKLNHSIVHPIFSYSLKRSSSSFSFPPASAPFSAESLPPEISRICYDRFFQLEAVLLAHSSISELILLK